MTDWNLSGTAFMNDNDGWGDDQLSDEPTNGWENWDDNDDYVQHEEPVDVFHEQDVNAAQQALAEALQSGNDDAIDEAQEEVGRLQEPVQEKKKNRKKKHIPPPQTTRPADVDGVFDSKGVEPWEFPPHWKRKKNEKKKFPSLHTKTSPRVKHARINMRKPPKKGKGFTVVESTKSLCGTVKIGAAPYRKPNTQREQAHERLAERSTVGSRFTCPCKAIMKGLVCDFGDRCAFAHTPEQLTVRMCHFGDACKYKSTCRFGHPCDHEQKTAEARKKMAERMPK